MIMVRCCLLVLVLAVAGCATSPYQPTPEQRLARQVIFTIEDDPPPSAFGESPSREASRHDLTAIIGNIISLHRLKMVSQWTIEALGLKAILAEVEDDQGVDRVLESLERDDRVRSVERVQTYDLLSYNDPYFHMQTASVKGAGIEHIHSLATGRNTVVAIVDTGVDRDHPELAPNILTARNFVMHDRRSFDDDEHGTSVAGVIAAAANNDLGIVGVAPEAQLMVLKACWQDSLTRRARCDSHSIIKALMEVLKRQPDVLNLSLSGPPNSLIERLLAVASGRGVVVVAAIDPGNSASFPASLDYVLAVGAPLEVEVTKVPTGAVLAPGTDILTTAPGATYVFRSGSSMAAAYVSGIAALLKERKRGLSTGDVVAHLQSTSRQRLHTLPVVDACQAVAGLVMNTACPTDADGALVFATEP